jgi:hypothetical protein
MCCAVSATHHNHRCNKTGLVFLNHFNIFSQRKFDGLQMIRPCCFFIYWTATCHCNSEITLFGFVFAICFRAENPTDACYFYFWPLGVLWGVYAFYTFAIALWIV